MKKLLLSIGTIAAVATPAATIIACTPDMGETTLTIGGTSTLSEEDAKTASADLSTKKTFADVYTLMGIENGPTSTNTFVSAKYDPSTKVLTTVEKVTTGVEMKITTNITLTFEG